MEKMTRNDLKQYNYVVLEYTQCKKLIKYFTPCGYNAGVYGHNWYFYKFHAVGVIIGCRNLTGLKPEKTLVQKYEDIATNIDNDSALLFEDKKDYCKNLMYQLLDKLYFKYFRRL